jgi:beta-1,4-mannosyl-glycoprotein beta-1,4-N-acetylglucosaminyltransferase
MNYIEVIIVANGCTDGTKEYIQSLGEPFKLIWFDDVIGYTKATNEGIRQSSGEYVLLLNNDTVLYPQSKHHWIAMLLAPFIDEKMAITGVKELVCPIINRTFLIFFCVLIKRSIFSELGLLDEIFAPFFGEDIDYCQRVVQAGYKFVSVGAVEQNGNVYSNFPIYHKAEGTLQDDYIQNRFAGTMPRNNNILLDRYGSKSQIYDCFPFFNELDLLEIRLNELNDVVDKFVIVEANLTHSGQIKPLYFDENKMRFTKFADKIIHIVVDDFPDTTDPWVRERFQRDAILRGLVNCKDSDVIIISDADEIPRKEAIFAYNPSIGIASLEQFVYYYYLDYRTNEKWIWSKILTYGLLKQITPCGARYYNEDLALKASFTGFCLKSGGWHFSFMGGEDKIIAKIEAYGHQEYNNNVVKDTLNINNCLDNKKDLFNRDIVYESVDINGENSPQYLIDNIDKYKHLLSNKKDKKDLISIIIPTYNHLHDSLIPCLNSIIEYTDLQNVEIIIVANGCTDDTKQYIESLGSPFKLLWFLEPLGYLKATNEGIKVASGEWIVLLNNDIILLPQNKNDWIDILKLPFEKESVGITGPMRVHCEYTNYDYLIFFCVMIKAKLFKEIGLLDEIFGLGFCEDVDFCIKAQKSNYSIVEVPNTETYYNKPNFMVGGFPIYHKGHVTFKDDIFTSNNILQHNRELLSNRYKIIDVESLIGDKLEHKELQIQSEFTYSEIFTDNTYAIEASDVKDAYVVDVGAFYGFFSIRVADLGAKYILSVEANNYNYNKMLDNIKDYTNIVPINKALYYKDGEIVQLSNEQTGSKIVESGGIWNVETITLKTLFSNISKEQDIVLKLDCEGAEHEAIYNTSIDLIRRCKIIYIEIHGSPIIERSVEQLVDHIIKMGFRVVWHVDYFSDNTKPKETEWKTKTFKFVRNELPVIVKNELPVIVKNDKNNTVTAVISTKDRYFTTLPLVLTAIANQTIAPNVLRIFDDGEQMDLRQNPLYTNILRLLDQKNIKWFVHFGDKKGQVLNHQKSIIESDTEWIWRLDDDNVPEYDVLEKLLSVVDEKTGAVGGLVLDPKFTNSVKPDAASNKIEDIFTGLNIQWFKHEGISEVDHLYSSFIYRREAAKHGYCMELSPVGHREETIFTYEMKRNGWKLLVNPDAVTWHFRNSEGGIRSYPDQSLWQHDEAVFAKKINLWSIIPINRKIVILNNGLGDHLAFRHILPEMKNKYGVENILIACCFNEVFADDGVALIPIQDAILYFNNNIIACDIYKMMWDMNWKGSLVDAFRRMYLV